MLEQNVIHSNDHLNCVHTPTYPERASDYEAARQADAPQPKWRDQWPAFTHNCGWTDSDGKTHIR